MQVGWGLGELNHSFPAESLPHGEGCSLAQSEGPASQPGLIHLQTGCPVQPRAGEGRGTPWKELRCKEDGNVASVPGSHSGLFTVALLGRLSRPGPGRHVG